MGAIFMWIEANRKRMNITHTVVSVIKDNTFALNQRLRERIKIVVIASDNR